MSKELTDAWKVGKLKALRLYYVLYKNGHIGKANLIETPDYYGFWNNCDLNNLIKEVLALVPDYTEFVHLETIVARQSQRIKELEKEVERKQKFINAFESPVFREELYKLQEAKIVELASLLKECRKHLQVEMYNPETGAVYNNIVNLLNHINASIGESEE